MIDEPLPRGKWSTFLFASVSYRWRRCSCLKTKITKNVSRTAEMLTPPGGRSRSKFSPASEQSGVSGDRFGNEKKEGTPSSMTSWWYVGRLKSTTLLLLSNSFAVRHDISSIESLRMGRFMVLCDLLVRLAHLALKPLGSRLEGKLDDGISRQIGILIVFLWNDLALLNQKTLGVWKRVLVGHAKLASLWRYLFERWPVKYHDGHRAEDLSVSQRKDIRVVTKKLGQDKSANKERIKQKRARSMFSSTISLSVDIFDHLQPIQLTR